MEPVASLQMETGDGLTLESLLGSGGMEEQLVERMVLHQAMGQLPEQERKVLLLRYDQGMTQSNVSRLVNTMVAYGYLEKDERKTRALSVKGGSGTAFRSVPILGTVTAGLPILAQEDTIGYVPYDGPEQGEMFALQVRGESMIGAGILDGDIVLVRRQNTAISGQIIVAMIGEEATVKRLALRADGVWLMPENPAFEPIDGRECAILGLVVSLYRPHV